MKSEHLGMVYRRRSIAQLLWALHALRRCRLFREEVLGRLSELKNELGPAFKYVKIGFTSSANPDNCMLEFSLNKAMLRRAESRYRALTALASTVRVKAAG
jgi:hypothetical protein